MNDSADQLHEKIRELQQTLSTVEAELTAIIRRKEQEIEGMESMLAVRLTRYLRRRKRGIKRALRSVGLRG